MNKILYFLILLLFPLTILFGDTDSEIDEGVRYISQRIGVKMYERPSLSGKVTGIIPYGEEIFINDGDDKNVTISGKIGRWVMVMWKGKYGWVFNGFLSEKKPSGITHVPGDFLKLQMGFWSQEPEFSGEADEHDIYRYPGCRGMAFLFSKRGFLHFDCRSGERFYCAVESVAKAGNSYRFSCNNSVPITSLPDLQHDFIRMESPYQDFSDVKLKLNGRMLEYNSELYRAAP